MKFTMTLFLSFFAVLLGAQNSFAGQPRLISMAPKKAFIPGGFDNNDQVQVALAGFYPDTCYKSGPNDVQVDVAGKRVLIRNGVYLYKAICLDVVVPYTKIVDLGVLPTGKYAVLVEDRDLSRADGNARFLPVGNIEINKSHNPGPDDYLYAPVTDAYLEKDAPVLVLRGTLTSDCMKVKDVKIIPQPQKGVVVIQPIAEMNGSGECHDIAQPFEVKVNVPATGAPTLFHIRALNGRSINVFAGI